MSYAGPSRARGTARSDSSSGSRAGRTGRAGRGGASAAASSGGGEGDWQTLAIFGAGVELGIAIGAGAALIAAPRSGAETRAVLLARASRAKRATTRRGHDAWDDLGDELRRAKRVLRRRWHNRSAERDLRRELELETVVD